MKIMMNRFVSASFVERILVFTSFTDLCPQGDLRYTPVVWTSKTCTVKERSFGNKRLKWTV